MLGTRLGPVIACRLEFGVRIGVATCRSLVPCNLGKECYLNHSQSARIQLCTNVSRSRKPPLCISDVGARCSGAAGRARHNKSKGMVLHSFYPSSELLRGNPCSNPCSNLATPPSAEVSCLSPRFFLFSTQESFGFLSLES
jgi:hypothetical protein